MGRVLLALALAACGSSTPPDLAYEQPGPHAVTTTRFVVDGPRALVVQGWLPSTASASDTPITQLEIEPVRTRYDDLLAAAPACPRRTLPVSIDQPVTGMFPLVVISHCHACTRLSNATTAIRLASHGFAVVSVEHGGDTLWERLDGIEAPIDSAVLELRTADVRAVLDAIASGATPVSAHADLAHVGVLGHSMGAVTAGRVAELDDRIDAAAALCAPVENPLVAGVTLAAIDVPLLFVVAQEDNSITELGNLIARNNFRDAKAAAYKLELPDAGHWSVSDLAGLVDLFLPGCGVDRRQTDDTEFTYLDPETGRAITAAYATAFFAATLRAEAGARAYLEAPSASFGVALDVQHH